jgi:3,4-dihydroxy 2-butanone 4-phosphate synthase/GTP cyclohydrolase II
MLDAAALRLDAVERAVSDIATGKAVVVVDDEDRENEGDIVFAASGATAALVAFTIRHTSGVICVPMEGATLDRLGIPLMTAQNRERMRTAYTVSVDATDGITTGISAADRARTIQVLVGAASAAADVTQPGHVFPLRYREGGVLVRRGHTEAAVDLARLAGQTPAGVIAEIVNDDGTMKRGSDLREFADEHGLALISIADLARYRNRHEQQLVKVVETPLPTEFGTYQAHGYRHLVDDSEQIALVYGDISDGRNVLVRVHSECLTGDVFGSRRCDCGSQLRSALAAVTSEGRGVVVYLRGHEGRGIGLVRKLQAYALQDSGSDTVDANLALGLPADARDYATGAQILRELGITSVWLLTNNPAKRLALESYGVEVTKRIAVPVSPHDENEHYLATKRDRMGHELDHLTFGPAPAITIPARTDKGRLP